MVDARATAVRHGPGRRLAQERSDCADAAPGGDKVGWSSVVGAGIDVVHAVVAGRSVPHVLAKDGSTIAASSAAGGLTAAGVAAAGGPPGWAVAAGIVVSTGMAWAMSETGAADWAADRVTSLFD